MVRDVALCALGSNMLKTGVVRPSEDSLTKLTGPSRPGTGIGNPATRAGLLAVVTDGHLHEIQRQSLLRSVDLCLHRRTAPRLYKLLQQRLRRRTM